MKQRKIKVDAASIMEAVRKPEKQRVTLYLDKQLYRDFKRNCKADELVVSDVAEQLMREFNKSCKG